jgi:predicted lipoprotein with Yx(FWY)xxD motif
MPKQRKPDNAGTPDPTEPAAVSVAADPVLPGPADANTVDSVTADSAPVTAVAAKRAPAKSRAAKPLAAKPLAAKPLAAQPVEAAAGGVAVPEPVGDQAAAAGSLDVAGNDGAGTDATGAEKTGAEPTDAATTSVGSADGDKSSAEKAETSRVAYGDMLPQPSKAERAAARQAAAEPGFVGLVATKPTIPRQPVPAESDVPTPGTRSKAWRIVSSVAAVVAFVGAVFAVSASESTDVLADTLPTASLSTTPSPSTPPPAYLSVGTGTAAGLLVIPDGHVLYYNDQDGPPPTGVPACVDTCAQAWSPLVPPEGIPLTAGPGVFGFVYTTVRLDGTTQITFNGHPLYEFTVDGPGNVTGNGLTDVFNGKAFSWHAASATDTPVIPSPSASPSPLLPPTPSLSPSPSSTATR